MGAAKNPAVEPSIVASPMTQSISGLLPFLFRPLLRFWLGEGTRRIRRLQEQHHDFKVDMIAALKCSVTTLPSLTRPNYYENGTGQGQEWASQLYAMQ